MPAEKRRGPRGPYKKTRDKMLEHGIADIQENNQGAEEDALQAAGRVYDLDPASLPPLDMMQSADGMNAGNAGKESTHALCF